MTCGALAFEGKEGYYCFHAGTKVTEDGVVTNGGRVLGATAVADSLPAAIENAYKLVEQIHFDNAYYRHDIGAKALKAKEV